MPRTRKKNVWPFSSSRTSPRQTTAASARSASLLSGGPVRYRASKARLKGASYKGYKLFESADGNWHYSGEKESAFDSMKDVKRFVDSLGKRRNKKNPDVVDRAVGTGMDIWGDIYEVPYSLFAKGVQTSLQLKDAVKKKIGLNPESHQAPLYLYLLDGDAWKLWRAITPGRDEEWKDSVRTAVANPAKYRLVRSVANPRRKPNTQQDADYFYEKFHGEPSQQTVVVKKEVHEPTHLGGIGPLVEVWIETPTGLVACIQFPRNNMPLLSSNKKGTQLYIEGGDQDIDLGKLGMGGSRWVKDRMTLGRFAAPSPELKALQLPYLDRGEKYKPWNITYQTRKSFDDFELIDYQHDLGEGEDGERERREPPSLDFEPENEQLIVTGGEYHIKLPLIGVSPGIEN